MKIFPILFIIIICFFSFAEDNISIAEKEFQIALSEDDDDRKLEIYDRIIRYAPDFMPALYNRALLLMKKKLWEEAKVDLKFYIQRNGNDFNALNNLAYVEYRSGNRNDAVNIWSKALKLNPDNSKIMKNMAMALYESGRKKEALYFVDRYLSFNKRELPLLRMKALILRDFSDRSREEKFLAEFLTQYAEEFDFLYRYARILSAKGRKKEAFQFAVNIIDKSSPEKRYFFLLVSLSVNNKDIDYCLSYLEGLLQAPSLILNEKEISYIAEFVRLNISNPKTGSIITILLEDYANNFQLMMLKALSVYKNGEYQKAKSLALDILAENNADKQALDIYFNSFIKLGEEEEFLSVMQERRDRGEKITYNAAVMELKIMVEKKRLEEAHQLCENYLQLFPQNAEFQMAAGNILLNNNMLDEAILYLEKAYALEHSFYQAGVLYAKALYRKGFSEDALNIMRDLYEAFSIERDVVLTYVYLLNESGDQKLARSVYEKFSKQEPLPDYDYYFSEFQNRGL